jgi:hypothetical protein
MAPKGYKRPRWAEQPPTQKRASSPDSGAADAPFSWRLGRFDPEFPKRSRLDAAALEKIRAFLSNLETMTFPQACQRGIKAQLVRVEDMPERSRRYLRSIRREDTDELVELKLGNMPRLWGVQIGAVFHVLWWDPDYEVWPSPKKNT